MFKDCRSCGDLIEFVGFNSVFECDDFGTVADKVLSQMLAHAESLPPLDIVMLRGPKTA